MANMHAFWSYSRQLEELGAAELHQCMQGALGDKLALLTELRIFRDNDPRFGIPSGTPWPQGIVDALAPCALFFWLQSPRWWRSQSCCRLEWLAFRDRVSRVAGQLWSGHADQAERGEALWRASVVPIRLSELTSADRVALSDTALEPMLAAWDQMQVLDDLNFPRRRHFGQWRAACLGAAEAITEQFLRTLAELGTSLPELVNALEHSAPEFRRYWLPRFSRPLPAGTAPPPTDRSIDAALHARDQLARRHTGGRIQRSMDGFDLNQVLVAGPGADECYWISSAPLPHQSWGAWLARTCPDLRLRAPSPCGTLRLDRHGMRILRDRLASFGLDLPDPALAEVLTGYFGLSGCAERLGFVVVPRHFWHSGQLDDGDASPPAEVLREVLLVSRI